jgi:minor histocompatibility antigen H13
MIRFRIDYQNNNYFDYSINVFDIFYLVVSLCIVIMYHLTKHYILSNCIAISISIIGIKLVQLDSFKTAMVLLTLLFFYDIFWVFKTNVMVTVATTLDFPLKLQIPKSFFSSIESNGFSILGLGDIVVPGLFLHLLYQLDKCHKTSYYRIGLCFYQIGLLAAIVCCLYFETGQPALLYICPSVIGSAIGTSLYRHEWDLLWNFIIPNENQVDSNSKVVKTTNQYRYSLRNRNRNK